MEKKRNGLSVLKCMLFLLAVSHVTIIPMFFQVFSQGAVWLAFLSPILLGILYFLFRKQLIPAVAVVNAVFAGIILSVITILFIVGRGNTDGSIIVTGLQVMALLFPPVFLMTCMERYRALAPVFILIQVLTAVLLPLILMKKRAFFKKFIPFFAFVSVLIAVSAGFYINRPSARYAGHGFEFMHGFSSTDFKDYMVYSSPSRLASLDHEASLRIREEEDMPILDGAEACYPLYAAVAKAVYQDIERIERDYLSEPGANLLQNGKIVRFTNTVVAYQSLVWSPNEKGPDLVFGARPSKNQLEFANSQQVPMTVTPIGREAFVFFVEKDNPVTNLTSDQIRKIYHGDITNWAEVGGGNQPILAFQRPADSGSQAMMEYFMGDVELKEPETYEYVNSMAGITKKVAQYTNERGALGYSFRYFVEDLNQEKNVRILSVDGVLPTVENIKNGTYPLTTSLNVISRTNDPNENVQKMIDFLLSPDGQELIEKTGYAGLSATKTKTIRASESVE